ncbi:MULTISPECIES: hypothetical protein [unclassified Nocardia]|uniref:hypothetical protein n=1 Tax=unclassified Nocardia TaxID=2637762 RepID=UPI0033BBA694
MTEKTDTAADAITDSDPGAETTADTATAAAESPTAAAQPEAVLPTKWQIRRMIALLIWRKIRIPLLIAVAVVAVVLAAVFGWKLKQDSDTESAAEAGLAAARAYAVTLTSVDSGNLDHDFTAVLDGSTGEFKDMYTRSSGQLRQLLVENKAAGKGTVLDAAVKSAQPDKVEVLLFIDQTVSNAAATDPRIDRSRVQMTMELVDGRWLASRVTIP